MRNASAHLLQAQAERLGALHGVDEPALAHRLFDDVTKVFKKLQGEQETWLIGLISS